MIYVLHGDDSFSIAEAVASLKEAVQPAELRDVNVTTLAGSTVGFEELSAVAGTVPFLAEKRLVLVEGLLSAFETRPASAGASKERRTGLGQWEALAGYLAEVPATTDLVFIEGRLTQRNPLFARVKPLAEARAFPLPRGPDLQAWIRRRAAAKGTDIEPRAVAALADSVGSDLHLVDVELSKLALYRWGETVRFEDVQDMVASAKEANIFAAVDAVLEGRSRAAVELTHQLLDSGRPPLYVISMLGRQVRLLLLAKELRGQRLSPVEIGRRLGLSDYPTRRTLEQETRFTMTRLVQIHRTLLEADLAMKTASTDEGLILDLMVAELASTAC